MATPAMQQQTLQCNITRGSVAIMVSQPVLKADGTPVDFTVGSWGFGWRPRPANANPTYSASSVTGSTISGDANGILTIELDDSVADQLPSLNGSFAITASNDSFTTHFEPVVGGYQINPQPPV